MSAVDSILNNTTLTTDGYYIFRAGSSAECSVIYNIIGTVTGNVTFTIAEVDPADESTIIGSTKTTSLITAAGSDVITISLFNSTTVKVSWDVSVGGSIGGTTLTVFKKDYPGLASITFGAAGGAPTIEKTISLSYDFSIAATAANQYQRAITYTVPNLYTATILKFTSYQNEAAFSRVLVPQTLGSHNNSTNTFTAGTSYSNIQFGSIDYLLVTTAIASGAGSVTYTVTYTNQDGTAGRTGTATVPRGSAVGTQWSITLQGTDYGIRSVQNISGTPTTVGIVDVISAIPLAIHADRDSTTQVETVFAPGVLTVATGGIITIEWNGGGTAKQRIFDVLFQLIQ